MKALNKKVGFAYALLLCICLCSCTKIPVESFSLDSASIIDPSSGDAASGEYGGEPLDRVDGAVDPSLIEFKAKDHYEEYADGIRIALSDAAGAAGVGYSLSDGKLNINNGGTYVLQGKLSDGQIKIDAPKDADVRLVLEGVDIYCSYSAPLLVNTADKVIISLPSGYENKLADKSVSAEADGGEITAAVFSHESISINGEGTLNIKAAAKDGITSKDTLKIMGGAINIEAADDGIVGKDRVLIAGGSISVSSVGDGIKSTNTEDEGMGYIYISGGRIDIKSDGDAIFAQSSMLISGGELSLKTGGGAETVTHSGEMRPGGFWGGFYTEQSTADTVSAKGLKATSYLDISGGSFDFDCADDAVHSNNTVRINNGKMSIATGDDGVHADTSLEISGGEITVSRSYEGIEAQAITVSGGYLNITSSDDAINAAGGSDGAEGMGRPWQDSFNSSSSAKLHITGGEIYADASGDGIDSNGDITMDGGLLCVSGPTDNGNGYIDVGGSFYTNGGTLIAAGSSGMLVTPAQSSKQNSITLTVQGSAGSVISVTDKNGTEMISWKCAKKYSCMTFSHPDITVGEKYNFYVDGVLVSTVESTSTVTGSGMGGMNPGGMNPGGMNPGGDRPQKPGRI